MESEAKRILVVDNEESLCRYLSVVLEKCGYQVTTAGSAEQGLERLRQQTFAVVLHDLRMPGMDGIAFLEQLRQLAPQTVSVLMTAYSSWDSAVAAMRLGAFNYIRKPFDNQEIRHIIARAFAAYNHQADRGEMPVNLIGNTPQLREVQNLITRVGRTDSTVLILGESGTGKEVVAKALHQCSTRAKGKFVAVNCAAFSEGLLESEMFGHVKGAFTGASDHKTGLLEVANGGTFFLDELGEMPKSIQVKVLRAIEERCVKPVGGIESHPIDIRLIAATNSDLKADVEKGTFREDLYYRLNVIPITLPPLRERASDIPLLVGHLISRNRVRMGSSIKSVSSGAMDLLMAYDWPGNIRELDNVLQRAIAMSSGPQIEKEDVMLGTGAKPGRVQAGAPQELPTDGIDLEAAVSEYERGIILKALQQSYWSLKDTAALLKMNYRQLRYRIEKLGLRREG